MGGAVRRGGPCQGADRAGAGVSRAAGDVGLRATHAEAWHREPGFIDALAAQVREGLRDAITAERGLTVIGVASDGDEALRQIRALRPDLVVLDQDMPNRTGIEVLRIIRKELPNIGVVLFTLDDSIRASALGGGAASVVTKDSPVSLLIAELRRAGEARLRGSPAEVGAVFAVRSAARRAWGVVLRQQRTLTAMGVLAVAYAAAFLIVEPALGASAAILGLVPVALAGALVGPEAGILAAVVTAALNLALWQSTGHPIGEPFLTVGGNGVGFLALIGIGAGFGGMRTLRGSFDRSARRATALADAAIVLATSEGPETLHLLAAGALDVVPGEVALLFLPVPGGGIELVAAQGTPSGIVGARPSGDAITRAYTHGTASIVDAVVASTGVDLPHMRCAVGRPARRVPPGSYGYVLKLVARSNPGARATIQSEIWGAIVPPWGSVTRPGFMVSSRQSPVSKSATMRAQPMTFGSAVPRVSDGEL